MHEYTVSELSGAVKRSLEDGFGYVRVRGELGRVTRAGSGHVYLDLKDEKAVLSGVMWKGVASRLSIAPEQGMEVIATGKLSTFPGQSRYQIIIDSLEPAGAGALMALLEERKKKLAAEGLFAPESKRELPFLPEVIGVVTSPSGAVIRDILHRLRDRFPRHVIVWPTLVQGRGAEEKIAAAIQGFNGLDGSGVPQPDVLIVARGGGSLEDLWCFNEEVVVRAAAQSEIPLISAVGHETDTTLIDYASDRRAPTPTAAAEMAVPVRSELISDVLGKERRMVTGQARIVERAGQALRSAERGLGRPEDILATSAQRLDRAGERLVGALTTSIARSETRMASAKAKLSGRHLVVQAQGSVQQLSHNAGRLMQAARVQFRGRSETLRSVRLPKAALVRGVQDGREKSHRLFELISKNSMLEFNRRNERLASVHKLLETLSYKSALARGYAVVRNEKEQLVASAGAVKKNDKLQVMFGDGEISVQTIDTTSGANTSSKVKKTTAKSRTGTEQKSLFD